MAKKNDFLIDCVVEYLSDADGWCEREIRRGADEFFTDSCDISVIDDDELLDAAEREYAGPRDWPETGSLRDGIVYLAHQSFRSEFGDYVDSFINDLDDFEALFSVNPFADRVPDRVLDDYGVSVYWDSDHHVAIRLVTVLGRDWFLDVSGYLDLESDALLQLKRSVARGQEDDGGGEAAA